MIPEMIFGHLLTSTNYEKDEKKIVAEFEGKIGKREIAQGVLGSDSLIITLDDLKKIKENFY